MFFQKLENISEKKEYKIYSSIIEKLDQWLAYLPQSYKGTIRIEKFMIDSGIQSFSINLLYKIFKKLESDGLFEKRYIIYCPEIDCKHGIIILDTIEEVSRFINDHNDNFNTCDHCDRSNELTTNDVYFMYKLLDTPKKKEVVQNLKSTIYDENNIEQEYNLTTDILGNPQEYMDTHKDLNTPKENEEQFNLLFG